MPTVWQWLLLNRSTRSAGKVQVIRKWQQP
jgi:hypothetical protein